MRFGRTVAVLVLATGMMVGGALRAQNPDAVPPPQDDDWKSKSAPKTALTVVPWKQAELKPEHAILAQLNGRWQASVHVSEGPYARDRDTKGTAEGKLLMGGLFVQVSHSQKRMKHPFEGMMIYGFDQAIGKYTADWIDSSSTAIIHYVGTYDAEKKLLNMTAHYSDQKSRRLTISRTVTAFVDDKTWVYEEYRSNGVGEPETPIVAITFKRE